ncbi:hypothetical protein DPMN_095424 [Dreissena polymorpha]|uniref:Uncharacterized protein n=1 Tax=Dreissena polymorpha TaxID=45954 RepID=A0A9D4L7Y4_DREPO|nr:hypothetical protein DPMN_095424 [Dreissena polymorpha]
MKQESVQMGIPRKLMGWMALIVWTKQVQNEEQPKEAILLRAFRLPMGSVDVLLTGLGDGFLQHSRHLLSLQITA